MLDRSFPQLTAPAKQLLRRQPMTPGHGTDRLLARYGLRDNPRLVLVAPLPSTTSTSEDFQPPDRLRGSTTHCVHSKPYGQNQAADSEISTSSGRWPQNIAYDALLLLREVKNCAGKNDSRYDDANALYKGFFQIGKLSHNRNGGCID